MEAFPKSKKGMAAGWVVLIAVVVMLGLAAGAYYYFNQKFVNEKNDLQNQITNLEKQITDLKKTTTTTSTKTTTTTTTAGLIYENKTYNFSITFDKKWADWKVKYAKNEGSTGSYYIEVPTTDKDYSTAAETHDAGFSSMFAISVYTKAEWEQLSADPVQTETKLGENDKYIFAWSHAQAAPEDVLAKGIWEDISTVIGTFKLQ